MKLPVCKFDLESDMLCPNCQAKLDNGEITQFDIGFSKWLLEREKEYPNLNDLSLSRAVQIDGRIVLIVKKKNKALLESQADFINELKNLYGDVIIVEGSPKLRTVVRSFIHPAIEVGVNSLYLPDGTKESIVMLHSKDRERITYSNEDLRKIVSAIMGQSVLFEYQDDRNKPKDETAEDEFDLKMKELSERVPRR
ncbi:MAG: hypothetical protein ACTSV3_03060 [Candidatus Thorarchaeota archaeon]|nr:MAG: hypothetical protein DRP09_08395 [Candidatus Thorarchaeota archaeon]RLI59636.1 MAG: hypothetical protein DRO87_02285 [Candidatus Thorarchaeota archaeon]